MSNNQMVSVPRELVEFAVGFKRNGHKNLTDQRSDQDNAQDKLRALLERPAEQHQGEPVETAVFNDPLYNAESDARNASSLLEEVLEWFDDGVGRSQAEFKLMRKIGAWLGRSAPSADGESDECAHSYANGVGCPERGKEFGAEPSAPKCCTPTAEEEALLASGDYRPEELWGGIRPTCPKCIKSEPSAPVEIDERAELEAYCAKVGLPLDRLPSGDYLIPATRFVSQGWHAHAASGRKP